MKRKHSLRAGVWSVAVLALATFLPSASASVIGHLAFQNCLSDGVTVTISAIDFLPAGITPGCILAGAGTTVAFDFGTVTTSSTGTVNDLPGGNAGFITFPGVMFNLVTIGPGIPGSGGTCATTANPALPACSPFAGSPFILTPNSSGTSIALAVSGFASDATSSNSPWIGAFTTQVSGLTPAQIQAQIIAPGGAFTATYSFDGLVTAGTSVPEPVGMVLIGGGLIALAGLRRRKSRA